MPRIQLCFLKQLLIALILAFLLSLSACKMTDSTDNVLPRNQKLPLFDPHVASYTCAPAQLAPFDAQANAWFQETRTLESPEIFIDDRDYIKIIALTRQAAERQHWKAMLNLASYYVEGRDPPHGEEDAVKLVEAAMRLGIPAAYDRMGTYYMNGTGVKADATRAYAFWQKAAQMGSPEALTDLGRKMISVDDHPERDRWANETIGTRMLECAYGQGYADAAYKLGFQYSMPTGRNPTQDELHRALIVWHNGVKFGSAKCAAAVAGEFESISDRADRMVLHTDIARAERYYTLARALEFDPDRRFPNLDKILPLPPAELPPWNGDRDTLINAARGISHLPSSPRSPSAYSERKGRFYLESEYHLAPTNDVSSESIAPFAGYWQPFTDDTLLQQGGAALTTHPALYETGESYERVYAQHPDGIMDRVYGLTWRLWRTVRHDEGTISPPVVRGRTRLIAPPAAEMVCRANALCPISGTWQPWMKAEHPLRSDVNQYWRQAWIVAGQPFPQPRRDWMVDVNANDVSWHLMDSIGIDIGRV